MSGRPINPAWSVPIWAPDANYPASADPWTTTPCKVDHPGRASVGFTPKSGVGAQCVNKLWNECFTVDQSTKDSLVALYDYLGQLVLLSFQRLTIAGSMPTVGPIKYCAATNMWHASTDKRTQDLFSWSTTGGGAGVTNPDGNFDLDTPGNIVTAGSGATNGVKVAEFDGTAWTTHATAFGTAYVRPDVVYDPVSTNWIVAGKKNGVLALQVHTSTDRATWTAQTAPTVPDDGNGPNATLATDGLGNIVMQSFKSSIPSIAGGSVSFSKSTDGGVTWSTADTHVNAFPAGSSNLVFPKPIWTGSVWLAVEFNDAGGGGTLVYSSADGLTFSLVATLTSVITSIAAHGSLIAGITLAGKVVFSIDSGVTWRQTSIPVLSGGKTIAAVDGRLVVPSTSYLYVSSGTGLSTIEVT